MKAQNGSSLIEVLVALLIFSLGILATSKMQVFAIRLTKSAELRSLASKHAMMLAESAYAFTTVPALINALGETSIENHGTYYRIKVSWKEPQSQQVQDVILTSPIP